MQLQILDEMTEFEAKKIQLLYKIYSGYENTAILVSGE